LTHALKIHPWTWIPDSGPFQPVPGRKFHVDSDFWIKFSGFRHPGAKIEGKRRHLKNSFTGLLSF